MNDFMESLGWEYVPTGPNEWEWLKFDASGKCIASQGDETWTKDCSEWEAISGL